MAAVLGWFRELAQALLQTALDSVRIWRLALWVPLLVVIPEFIQHCVEINIGMFESREAARALNADPQRMLFGSIKVAGLVAAIVSAAAFWARRAGTKVLWRALAIAFAWNVAATALISVLQYALPDWTWLNLFLSIAALPLFVPLVGALFGDREMTLGKAYRSGWFIALRIFVVITCGWFPLSRLHAYNHAWAMGQSQPAVWGLMVFDALVVGLLACWAGTAFHHAYRPAKTA